MIQALFQSAKVTSRSRLVTYNNHSIRTMSKTSVPSSLQGAPIKSLVPIGQCQFNDEPIQVPLIERTRVSPTSSVLRFGLPDATKPLNLSTCACILATADIGGESVTRPYTPISTNAHVGYFDMLIKDYGEGAKMSRHMHEIAPGDKIAFKHIKGNVKMQAPFPYKKIAMLVGGTGITPFIQALHAMLGETDGSGPVVTVLYGSRVQEDILGDALLQEWAKNYPEKFTLVNVLSHEPEDSTWKGVRGHPNKALIEEHFPNPDEKDIQIFICGPPPMYNALSGPREEKELGGLLKEMGYSAEQVYKF